MAPLAMMLGAAAVLATLAPALAHNAHNTTLGYVPPAGGMYR